MRRTILFCCVSLLGCASSFAQSAPAGSNPVPTSAPAPAVQTTDTAVTQKKVSPAKEADIRRLLTLTGATTTIERAMQNMEKSLKPVMANSLPAGDYRETLINLFFEKFHSKMDVQKMIDLAVPLYDKYYTTDDIKGLIQFYETPLGRKTVKALPSLMGELTEASQRMGQDFARQSMLEVMAEHPELEKAMEDAQRQN